MHAPENGEVLEPLLNGQEISDDHRVDNYVTDPDPIPAENGEPNVDQAGPSSVPPNTGIGQGSDAASTCTLSFFDDYSVVDGILHRVIDTSDAMTTPSYTISRNGCKIAVVNEHADVRVLDICGHEPTEQFNLGCENVTRIQFQGMADTVILCADDEGLLTKWERQGDGAWSNALQFQCPVSMLEDDWKMEISRDGRYLAFASVSNTVCQLTFYDIAGVPHTVGAMREIDLRDVLGGIQFSPYGRGFLMHTRYQGTLVWPDFMNGDVRFDLKGSGGRWIDGGRIATSDFHTLLWDIEDLLSGVGQWPGSRQIASFQWVPEMEVFGEVVGVSGDRIFVRNRQDYPLRVSVWNVDSGELLGHMDAAMCNEWDDGYYRDHFRSCVSRNGQWMAVYCGATITIWDACKCIEALSIHLPESESNTVEGQVLTFVAGGNKLIFACSKGQHTEWLLYDLDALEEQHELVYEIPVGYTPHICKFSKDGGKIGVVLHSEGYLPSFIWIWSLVGDNSMKLERTRGSFVSFCFSHHADRVVTISLDGSIALWDIRGTFQMAENVKQMCDIWQLPLSSVGATLMDVSFTRDDEGAEMVVVLVQPLAFVWIDMEGELVHEAELEWDEYLAPQYFGHRFSSDGAKCVICLNKKCMVEVWDMVQRQRLQQVDFGILHKVAFQMNPHDFAQQVSMDGARIVLGMTWDMKPWLASPEDTLANVDVRKGGDCKWCDMGKSHVLGAIGVISEDGEHITTCETVGESTFRAVVKGVGQCMDVSRGITFLHDASKIGMISMSSNGQRIAWVDSNRICVWDPNCDDRCIPDYARLKMAKLTSDHVVMRSLLDKHGKNLVTCPDANGWNLLARAIEDKNIEWTKLILQWARDNNEHLWMTRTGLRVQRSDDWMHLLQLALDKRSPGCAHLLLKATLDGTLVASNREAILYEALHAIIDKHPTLFVDVMGDSNMLQPNGEIVAPHKGPEGDAFLVCAHNNLRPWHLDDVWARDVPLFEGNKIWLTLRNMFCGRNKNEPKEDCLKVPMQSYVIPIEDFAQVGDMGFLGRILASNIGPHAFNTMPLKTLVEYKWAYGKEILTNNLYSLLFLMSSFTVYAVLLGMGCRQSAGLSGGMHVASLFFLAKSMLLSIQGLFGQLQSMISYSNEGRGTWYYWVKSSWNVVAFLSYILILVVIPICHFGLDPCTSRWGVSWAVPLTCILLWWRTLYYAQAFESTGKIILASFEIIKALRFFLILGVDVLVGFALAFYVLYRNDGEDAFGTIPQTLVTTFGMLLWDFDLEIFYLSHAPEVAITLYVAYVLAMAFVVLNLVIVIVGGIFVGIEEPGDERFIMIRACIIDDMEAMLSCSKKKVMRGKIGRFLHVLLPKDGIRPKGGKMNELECLFKRLVDESKVEMQHRMDELQDLIKQRTNAIEANLECQIQPGHNEPKHTEGRGLDESNEDLDGNKES